MVCSEALGLVLALAGLACGQTAGSGPAKAISQKMSTLRELPAPERAVATKGLALASRALPSVEERLALGFAYRFPAPSG